jgi:4-aminobutyrate aminotransferase
MIAIEFKDPASPITRQHSQGGNVKLPSYLNKLVQDECYDRDLVILTTSIYPVLRLVPALIVSEEEAERALGIIRESIKAVSDRISASSS